MLFDCGCIEPPPKIAILGGNETGMALAAALLSMESQLISYFLFINLHINKRYCIYRILHIT